MNIFTKENKLDNLSDNNLNILIKLEEKIKDSINTLTEIFRLNNVSSDILVENSSKNLQLIVTKVDETDTSTPYNINKIQQIIKILLIISIISLSILYYLSFKK
jgi:hypothetical protein